jgi:hypothetical protein
LIQRRPIGELHPGALRELRILAEINECRRRTPTELVVVLEPLDGAYYVYRADYFDECERSSAPRKLDHSDRAIAFVGPSLLLATDETERNL